jgi:hypothetical protein
MFSLAYLVPQAGHAFSACVLLMSAKKAYPLACADIHIQICPIAKFGIRGYSLTAYIFASIDEDQ